MLLRRAIPAELPASWKNLSINSSVATFLTTNYKSRTRKGRRAKSEKWMRNPAWVPRHKSVHASFCACRIASFPAQFVRNFSFARTMRKLRMTVCGDCAWLPTDLSSLLLVVSFGKRSRLYTLVSLIYLTWWDACSPKKCREPDGDSWNGGPIKL